MVPFFFNAADVKGLSNLEQVDNTIFEAKSEGRPFRGKPMEMASDVLSHINSKFFPVIIESWGGCDKLFVFPIDIPIKKELKDYKL